MKRNLVEQVWTRAQSRCEYCKLRQFGYRLPFQIDHILARQHGGATEFENLALSCFHCNRYKGSNIAGWDAKGSQLVRLFHPRVDDWVNHFRVVDFWIVGTTPTGRVTASLLNMNSPSQVLLRQELWEQGEESV